MPLPLNGLQLHLWGMLSGVVSDDHVELRRVAFSQVFLCLLGFPTRFDFLMFLLFAILLVYQVGQRDVVFLVWRDLVQLDLKRLLLAEVFSDQC